MEDDIWDTLESHPLYNAQKEVIVPEKSDSEKKRSATTANLSPQDSKLRLSGNKTTKTK